MTGFLAEIGQKLADRWAAMLALPGLLYLAVVATAGALGQRHALSYLTLSRQVTTWAASPAVRSAGGAVLIALAALAGSVVTGLAAVTGGRLVEALWTLPGRRRPARWLADWRRQRSRTAKAAADDAAATPGQVRRAIARADRICVIEACCPTWIGDRLRACHVRVSRAYGLDLAAAWPRLWLFVPDPVRDEIGIARDAYTASARLVAWAVLYLIPGVWWWPALVAALITMTTAVVKGRLATSNLADLIESAVDLHCSELAAQLGEATSGPVTPDLGRLLTTRMRKDRWDPASPVAD